VSVHPGEPPSRWPLGPSGGRAVVCGIGGQCPCLNTDNVRLLTVSPKGTESGRRERTVGHRFLNARKSKTIFFVYLQNRTMPYSEIEKEIIFLKAVQEMIDEMVNYELFDFVGEDPHSEIRFHSYTHLKFFNIVLVDFLSRAEKDVVGEQISYLEAIRKICANPHFDMNRSVDGLTEAVQDFTKWLEQDVDVEVWFLPFPKNEATLCVKRVEFLKICGNISKHNFTRLSRDTRELIEICKRNNINVCLEQALIMLNEFYERFHDDILNYHGSTIVEFLNNIRWGIHKYLKPEFLRSIVYEGGDTPKYRYTYPTGVEGDCTKNTYWDLMNKIRSGPIVKEFKASRWLKLHY
jgi:hypothetical protein